MKTTTLVSLLQATQGVQTVKVKFSNGGPSYTYKTFETYQPGDFVIAEARDAYSVAKVIEMDEVPDINPDADFDLKWIVQRIDTTRIEAIKREEASLARQISLTEAKKRIENVLKETGLNLADLQMPALLGSPNG